MDIPERIQAARLNHDFEVLAKDIESSPQAAAYLPLFRARLEELDLNLPQRLGEYVRRIMEDEHPQGEDIHKICSLISSLSCLERLGIEGAHEWLATIAGDVRQKRKAYGVVRGNPFGDHIPDWWKR